MNNLISKINKYVKIEKSYKKLKDNKANIDSEITEFNTFKVNGKKIYKDLKQFKDLFGVLSEIIALKFNKKTFLKDNDELIKNLESYIADEKYHEINTLLTKLETHLNNYIKTLISEFKEKISALMTEFTDLKKLSTISDLNSKYNELGNEFFTLEGKSSIDYIERQLDNLDKINNKDMFKYLKSKKEFIINLQEFFDKTKTISNISNISDKYNLSEVTSKFLLEIINQGWTAFNNTDVNILEELKIFINFKNNLIVSLKGGKE